MKQVLIGLILTVGIVGFARIAGTDTSVDSLAEFHELCPAGSTDDSYCQLDPNDCTRGIDESNQSSCETD